MKKDTKMTIMIIIMTVLAGLMGSYSVSQGVEFYLGMLMSFVMMCFFFLICLFLKAFKEKKK